MSEKEQERGLVCLFCGEGFGYAGQTPDEATLMAACNHESECPHNPYKAEIAKLKSGLIKVTEIIRCMRIEDRANEISAIRPPDPRAVIGWMLRQIDDEHGCLTYDCPHSKQTDCIEALYMHFVEANDQISGGTPSAESDCLTGGQHGHD